MGRPVVHFKIDVQGWSRTEERDIRVSSSPYEILMQKGCGRPVCFYFTQKCI
jgi:hypothetical protein